MAENPTTYRVEAGDVLRDREQVLAVWRGTLGAEAAMVAKYDWFYQQCPYGAPLLMLLRTGDAAGAIGVTAAGRRTMLVQGEPFAAGVLADLAVSRGHRSLFPALTLEKGVLAAGLREFSVIYGFPNPKAVAVCVRAGFQRLGEMTRYLRVLRWGHYLQRRLPRPVAHVVGALVDAGLWLQDRIADRGSRLQGRWHAEVPDAVDAIWRGSRRAGGPLLVRDAAFVRWRFARAGRGAVEYFVVSSEIDGAPLAWFAYEPAEPIAHVLDFWSVDGMGGVLRAALRCLALAVRARGLVGLSVEYYGTGSGREFLESMRFVARGARPIIYQVAAAQAEAARRWDWHLTSADEDE